VNIGSGYSHSINEILDKVKLFEPSFKWKYVDNKQFDNMTFTLKTNKLKSYIDDYSFTTLEAGIKKTFDWLKINSKQ